MHTAKWNDVEGKEVTDAGAEGVTIRVANAGDTPFTFLCVIPSANPCLVR